MIPLEATKEKREKALDLTDEEVELLREQLLDVYTRLRTETRYVFPKPHGSRWRYGHFHEDVWKPAKDLAIAAWRREHGHHPDDESVETPFDHVDASTLSAAPAWDGSERMSFLSRSSPSDSVTTTAGATLLRHYRYVRDGETRAALDGLGAGVRAHLRELAAEDDEKPEGIAS